MKTYEEMQERLKGEFKEELAEFAKVAHEALHKAYPTAYCQDGRKCPLFRRDLRS